MGLRQRQKTNRRNMVLDAASNLFVKKGYDATKAEEIAAGAELSVGTLYNYFTGKAEILITLMAIENERLVGYGAEFEPEAGLSASDTLCALLNVYFDPDNSFLNREVWRSGLSLSFADVTSDGARRLRRTDRELAQQVVDLVETLKLRHKIRQDIDANMFGNVVFNNANMLYFEFSRSEQMTMTGLRAQVAEMTDSIVSLVTPSPKNIVLLER